MNDTFANDLTWLKGIIEQHVACRCYFIRLGRGCRRRPWCLRTTHMQRLRFFKDALAFDLAMAGKGTQDDSWQRARLDAHAREILSQQRNKER